MWRPVQTASERRTRSGVRVPAVRLTFHLPGDAPVTWVFGRELLVEGVLDAAG
ncbi:SsgA family sporulation/cell division regulator, partial [Streptomyces albidoflavus]|uniref:SsgA family sporulation/cell division regulator n=1 Tax=Streptomyces albidoflavus TaxID=1886 RepID=UPI0033B071C4